MKIASALCILSLTTVNALALSATERNSLVNDLVRVESNGRANAIGDNGKAYGILQIHKITVDEANRLAKTNYTHRDMFDPVKARHVAEIVLGHYDRHIQRTTGKTASAKQLSFIWNGGAGAWKRVANPVNDTKQQNLERYWSKVSRNRR